jgi:hypothetical protein
MNYWLARMREPSTWRGLIWVLTAMGVSISPELGERIIAVGMAVAGLIGMLIPETPGTIKIELPPGSGHSSSLSDGE